MRSVAKVRVCAAKFASLKSFESEKVLRWGRWLVLVGVVWMEERGGLE